ncbi:hypothetical protein OB905_05890 [Halobacteria archaeon AArc-dxtr1]|nr:hypothetical protein [Halobacteria archaeon AArc-dxtr1]
MRIVVNQSTKTVHKPSCGDSIHPAICGALWHVPEDQISVTTDGELASTHEFDQCGRCFEGAGGY